MGSKPSPAIRAPVMATGVPKPAVASRSAPKTKAMRTTCMRRSLLSPANESLAGAEDEEEREETQARLRAAEAALARLEELADQDWVREETTARMRDLYQYRRRRFAAPP